MTTIDVAVACVPAGRTRTRPGLPAVPAKTGSGLAQALLAGGTAGSQLRSASVLSPLLAWAHPDSLLPGGTARSAVTAGDDDATDTLVESAGSLRQLLENLEEVSGVKFDQADDETPGWGQVPVRAIQVADAYATMAGAAELTHTLGPLAAVTDRHAALVCGLLDQVPATQRLGLGDEWAARRGLGPARVLVKVGWDMAAGGVLRTNAALIEPAVLADGGTAPVRVAACVLVASEVDAVTTATWMRTLSKQGPEALLPVHAQVHGDAFRVGLDVAAALVPAAATSHAVL